MECPDGVRSFGRCCERNLNSEKGGFSPRTVSKHLGLDRPCGAPKPM